MEIKISSYEIDINCKETFFCFYNNYLYQNEHDKAPCSMIRLSIDKSTDEIVNILKMKDYKSQFPLY